MFLSRLVASLVAATTFFTLIATTRCRENNIAVHNNNRASKSIASGVSVNATSDNEWYLEEEILKKELPLSSISPSHSHSHSRGIHTAYIIDTDYGSCLYTGQVVDLQKYYFQSANDEYIMYYSEYYQKLLIYQPYYRNRVSWAFDMRTVRTLELVGGNIAFRDSSSLIVYQTNTDTGNYAILQNDGNFVLYTSEFDVSWACNHASPTYCIYDRYGQSEGQVSLQTCEQTPSASPTRAPTAPTHQPSLMPTFAPSMSPAPSRAPTHSLAPTTNPTATPTVHPTGPSCEPTMAPTTHFPTVPPSAQPTMPPTGPSYSPTAMPTSAPTVLENRGNCLRFGYTLTSEAQQLQSRNGAYHLVFKPNGGLSIYKTDDNNGEIAITTWSYDFSSPGDGPYNLQVSALGNMKVQNGLFQTVYSANTEGSSDKTYAILQDDGNLVVYEEGSYVGWSCSSSVLTKCIVDESADMTQSQDELMSCTNKANTKSSSSSTSSRTNSSIIIALVTVACVLLLLAAFVRYRLALKNSLRTLPVDFGWMLGGGSEDRIAGAVAAHVTSRQQQYHLAQANIQGSADGIESGGIIGIESGGDVGAGRPVAGWRSRTAAGSATTAQMVSVSSTYSNSNNHGTEMEEMMHIQRNGTPPSDAHAYVSNSSRSTRRGRAATIRFVVPSAPTEPTAAFTTAPLLEVPSNSSIANRGSNSTRTGGDSGSTTVSPPTAYATTSPTATASVAAVGGDSRNSNSSRSRGTVAAVSALLPIATSVPTAAPFVAGGGGAMVMPTAMPEVVVLGTAHDEEEER